MLRSIQITTYALLIGILLWGGVEYTSAESSSASFNNVSESINCGGAMSSSATFKLMDTTCDQATGSSTSSSFGNSAGFEAMEDLPRISFTLSGTTISFGTLTTGAVASGSITTNVKTNAVTGYTTTIVADGGFKNPSNDVIDAVSDGTVTAGSEEYGMRTTGADGQFNSTDTGITTTPQIYATNSSPTDTTTTLTFKAAVSSTTPSGNYAQIVSLVATGRF